MSHKSRFFILMVNPISITGIFLGTCAFATGTFLVVLDAIKHFSNPYMGILTYLVAPGLLVGSIFLIAVGMLWTRSRMKRTGTMPAPPIIDFGNPRMVRRILFFWVFLSIFVAVSSVATYRTYHFTESVRFCGEICHGVMKPEYVAFANSPHANTTCAKCHIGTGAEW